MPVLFRAEKIPRASYGQVAERNAETAAQFRVLQQHTQPFFRRIGDSAMRRHREISVRKRSAPADSASQLIELRQSEAPRIYDDERVCVGQIYAVFDNGRGNENVVPFFVKRGNSLFQFVRRHLPVRGDYAHLFGKQSFERSGVDVKFGDVVQQDQGLPASAAFALDCVRGKRVGIGNDVGLHGKSALGRRLQQRNVANSRERHIEGARNGRCRQREHVDQRITLLQRLLVIDAEPLFFVEHQQAEVLEHGVLGQHLVGGNEEQQAAVGKSLEGCGVLFRGLKSREQPALYSERFEPRGQIFVVLTGENGGGGEQNGLLAVEGGLEHRPESDFRLAEADVADHDPVHNLAAFHILFDGGDCLQLVFRLFVLESVLELFLPNRIGRICEALLLFPDGVKLQQIERQFLDGLAHFLFLFGKLLAAEFVEPRIFLAYELLKIVRLVRRNVKGVSVAVSEHDVFLVEFACPQYCGTLANPHAVHLMHHIITRFRRDKLRFRSQDVFAFMLSDALGHAYYRHLFGRVNHARLYL